MSFNIAIFGASGAVGNGLCKHYQSNNLYKFSRNPKSSDEIPFDLSDEESISEAISTIPDDISLDIVVICTGILYTDAIQPEKAVKQLKSDNFHSIMTMNALGPALIAKHIEHKLQKDTRSVLAVISGRVGSISDNFLGGWHSYRASKAALHMLWRNISIEYKRSHPNLIAVCLHPGTVDSHLSAPFKRFVKPEKLFTPEQATSYLYKVIGELTIEDNGHIIAYDGTRIQP